MNRVCNVLSEAYVTPNIALFRVPVGFPGTFHDIRAHGEWRRIESRLLSVRSQTNVSDDAVVRKQHCDKWDKRTVLQLTSTNVPSIWMMAVYYKGQSQG